MRRAVPPPQFLNRELGQLAFNRRVLAQADDDSVPLLERLRFLTIVSSNLDEFFEIRVAGLKGQIKLGLNEPGPGGRRSSSTCGFRPLRCTGASSRRSATKRGSHARGRTRT